jgi:predicted nuclease of restriction endonuclease-like (RecB) superfamily
MDKLIQVQSTDNNAAVNFTEVVSMIRHTHHEVLHVANKAMVDLYWRIGEYISLRVAKSSWGKGIVAELANYIASAVPESKGYSASNLWRMKQFYETYAVNEKLATLLRELSWSNNLVIMSRSKSAEEREFYIRLATKERLSNRDLVRQFKACTFERTMLGNAKLSPVVRELAPQAEEVFKDQIRIGVYHR